MAAGVAVAVAARAAAAVVRRQVVAVALAARATTAHRLAMPLRAQRLAQASAPKRGTMAATRPTKRRAMPHPDPHPQGATSPRVALLAGASGLVGRELATRLCANPRYDAVHALVRRPTGLVHPKLVEHTVDFTQAASAWGLAARCDDVYIALGTTIKAAGSQAAFRAVDFDAVCAVAAFARGRGARHAGVVSAMGASSTSGVFYNRVKGEMEQALAALGFASLTVAQPSFLAGNRHKLAQAARPGEAIALKAFALLAPLIPRNYKSVQASDVAAFLIQHTLLGAPGVRIARSGELTGSP